MNFRFQPGHVIGQAPRKDFSSSAALTGHIPFGQNDKIAFHSKQTIQVLTFMTEPGALSSNEIDSVHDLWIATNVMCIAIQVGGVISVEPANDRVILDFTR